MKKALLLVLLIVGFQSRVLHATQVTVSGSPSSRTARDASNSILVNGDIFLLGTFSNPGAIINANPSTVMTLAGWTQFAQSSSPSFLAISSPAGSGGKLLGTLTDNTAAANAFNNKSLYIWIFNATTVNGATQQGIFSAPSGTPPWTFPTNAGGVGDTITIDSNDTNAVANNAVGSVTATTYLLVQIPVPEASSFQLLGAGALLLVIASRFQKARSKR